MSRDTPDPEHLHGYSPALVELQDDGETLFIANHRLKGDGWVWVLDWSGKSAKIPAHQIKAIHSIKTERYGERDREGRRSERIQDSAWRERAKNLANKQPREPPEETPHEPIV
jgi:hypothetical protein